MARCIEDHLLLVLLFVWLARPTLSAQDHHAHRRAIFPRNATFVPKQLNQTTYKALFQPPSNSTPRFVNSTGDNVNAQFRIRNTLNGQAAAQGEGTCAPGSPCTNGACCSKAGFCGYAPDFCGTENCISNCDAKAACGRYAVAGKEKCPLNVCCVSMALYH